MGQIPEFLLRFDSLHPGVASFVFKGINEVFEVFRVQGNAEQVLINQVMKPLRADLPRPAGAPAVMVGLCAAVIEIAAGPVHVPLVRMGGAHDGSAFLAVDEPGVGEVFIGTRRSARFHYKHFLDAVK